MKNFGNQKQFQGVSRWRGGKKENKATKNRKANMTNCCCDTISIKHIHNGKMRDRLLNSRKTNSFWHFTVVSHYKGRISCQF